MSKKCSICNNQSDSGVCDSCYDEQGAKLLRANEAIWRMWHLDPFVAKFLERHFPDINRKIEDARRGQ